MTDILRRIGTGEAIANPCITGQGRRQFMPHASANGMYPEGGVRGPWREAAIGTKALEGYLIAYKDTTIPGHIDRISQLCPHRIAKFIEFFRHIHVLDQASNQQTER